MATGNAATIVAFSVRFLLMAYSRVTDRGAKPDMAIPSSSPTPPGRKNENRVLWSHKTSTSNEPVEARVIGLANPGYFR